MNSDSEHIPEPKAAEETPKTVAELQNLVDRLGARADMLYSLHVFKGNEHVKQGLLAEAARLAEFATQLSADEPTHALLAQTAKRIAGANGQQAAY